MSPPPKLVVITDWALGETRLFHQLKAALGAGTPMAVQHRNPTVSTRIYFEQGQRLKALCDAHAAALFVSARLDVALALGAHLHLPSWALIPQSVRARLPVDRWLSVSVHDEAQAARAAGADFALVSPVFEKAGATPLGPEGFRRLARALTCPAYALGGLTPARRAALPTAAGVAVISAVLGAQDPAAAALAFHLESAANG